MPLLERTDSLSAARGIIAKSKAAETEVSIDSSLDRFVRYADCGPTQCADRERTEVRIRVRHKTAAGIQEAAASCGSLEPAAWKAALERAQELALASPPNPALAPLGGAVLVPMSIRDRATIDHTFEAKARWIKLALDACKPHALFPAGLAHTTAISRLVSNSAGREVHGYQTRASFSLTATGPSGEGWAEGVARTIGALKPEALVQRAVDKAVRAQDPQTLEPGEYTVVLEPAAVAALLLFMAYEGFGAREVEEQASFLCGRIGQQVFPASLTVRDDCKHPLWMSLPFDGEGSVRTQVALIEQGVPLRAVTDRNHAHKRGEESTGHGLPQPSARGPLVQNLVVQPGSASLDELVGGVKRGLLITQLHYVNLTEPRELLLTGMTRNGTFLIEDGRVGRAVRNLRFTDSLVRALGTLSGVSNELAVCGALFDGEAVVPALRLDGLRFTSVTAF
jgi:predicted Zn-dependent protease